MLYASIQLKTTLYPSTKTLISPRMAFADDKFVISLVHNEFQTSETIPHTHIPIPALDNLRLSILT